jgi:hypothetical protein
MKTIKEPSTGLEIYQCPTGCSFDDIEVGKEGQSFMAIMNAPYQYLRCSKCGFNEKTGYDDLSNNLKDSIEKWNKRVTQSNQDDVQGENG